jgi:hypothetical protein
MVAIALCYIQDILDNQLSRKTINIIVMIGREGLPKTAKTQLLIEIDNFAVKGAVLIAVCNMPVACSLEARKKTVSKKLQMLFI